MLVETNRDVTDWDLILPQVMRRIRATPNTIMEETANFLMLKQEVRLPQAQLLQMMAEERKPAAEYALDPQKQLRSAYELFWQQQQYLRIERSKDSLLYIL
jgi:hypothetical protein